MDLKQQLKKKLTKKEISRFKKSYDVTGDIAILEIPKELTKKEKIIATTLLKSHKNIKTVLKKQGAHKGTLRIQKMKFLAGENRRETTHRENNVQLKLDVEKTYFSPRMATERKRITEQIKKGESILVMFSGIAPYVAVIAKNTKAKKLTGIEINRMAHKYALENVKLNKLKNTTVLQGNVKRIMPDIKTKFDRVLLPLPKGAEKYLYLALAAVKKNGTIHFYDYCHEKDIPKKSTDRIDKACKKAKKKYKIIRTVKCGQLSPRHFRTCTDFQNLT
ncbi:MAG: tRNA (guanine-N1)-methyltransferase [bacterium]|nr:tRNA (guanine-N1)-methyltransferase [bacterium]